VRWLTHSSNCPRTPALLYPLVELVDDESAVIVGSGHRDGSITDVLSANIAAVATPPIRATNGPMRFPAGVRPLLRGFPNAPMRAVHLWAAPEPLTNTVSESGRRPDYRRRGLAASGVADLGSRDAVRPSRSSAIMPSR